VLVVVGAAVAVEWGPGEACGDGNTGQCGALSTPARALERRDHPAVRQLRQPEHKCFAL
jgi:hypothetical protein